MNKINGLIVLGFAAMLCACGGSENAVYTADMNKLRLEKDSMFKVDTAHSPLRFDSTFEHLNYFPANEDWIVQADFAVEQGKLIVIKDTKGMARDYVVYGKLTATVPTGKIELYAFRNGNEPYLFIPLIDATSTNGKSYGGGRFLETDMPDENMKVTLDFNSAYNPYCHYNHDYSCPIVPSENKLKVEILAGEKKYKDLKEDNH